MMWVYIGSGIYVAGFILIFAFHIFLLQMVTPPLALLRAALWPLYVTTGRPHGAPVRIMDQGE